MSTDDSQEPKRRGRPLKPEAERKSDNFKFRARGEIRDQLEKSALENRRSLSEEIEFRITQSFNYKNIYDAVNDGFARNIQMLFGGEDHALTMIDLASYLQRSLQAANAQIDSDAPWFIDPMKQSVVEDTFHHLSRRALRAAAARERLHAKQIVEPDKSDDESQAT